MGSDMAIDPITIAAIIVLLVLIGALFFIFRRNRGTAPNKLPSAGVAVGLRRNWLVGKSGSVKARNYHIGARTVTIGRGIGNYVQITDENASRVHCKLQPVPYGLEVTDNGSRNGTLINDKAITTQVLKDGDELKIGEDAFTYHAEGNFGENAGLQGKTADSRVGKATVMENQDFKSMLTHAITEANGDIDVAAKSVGISKDAFLMMLKKQGIDEPGDDA